jgi:hypothetical protein
LRLHPNSAAAGTFPLALLVVNVAFQFLHRNFALFARHRFQHRILLRDTESMTRRDLLDGIALASLNTKSTTHAGADPSRYIPKPSFNGRQRAAGSAQQ